MNNWIYKKTKDNKARYVLGENGKRSLVCIGINPSTAEPDNLDNTLTTVRNRSIDMDYDSWIMLNVYPQRATDPNNLDKELNKLYHKQNIKEIEGLLENRDVDIWAAWGTLIHKRYYLKDCLTAIVATANKYNVSWYTMGKRTKQGHPHHPLYLKRDLPLVEFDIQEYIIKDL